MHLADHIRPLLRDHDCVIIPDFGGLVAEPVPARLSAARLHLAPPAKQVAFNQSLTRNDGLLVDALSQYLNIPAGQAREVLRHAVDELHLSLRQRQRTELPGIGVFRQAPGRGLTFDYTGTDNLLPAAFGLPALSVRPVLATDARAAREKQPALLLQPVLRRRPMAASPRRWGRLLQGVGVSVIATLIISAGYLLSLNAGLPPAARPAAGSSEPAAPSISALLATPEPQQATLAHNGWGGSAAEAPATEQPLPNPTVAEERLAPAAPEAKPTAAGSAKKPVLGALGSAAGVGKAKTTRPAGGPKTGTGLAAPAATSGVVTTINHRTGRSYVVAGAFDTAAGAEACRRNLARGGFSQAKVLLPSRTTRRFRATVADYPDLASARAAAAQLRFKRKVFFDVYSY